MPQNFYELLDVAEDATENEIKAAYREMAREYHPDVNDDERASAQFKTVRKAYEVLTDADERAAYDRMGHATYVRKRLDGLPTAGASSGSGGRWSRSSRRGAGSNSGTGRTRSRSRGRSRSRSRSRSGDATGRGESADRSRTGNADRERASGGRRSARGTSRAEATGGPNRTRRARRTAGGTAASATSRRRDRSTSEPSSRGRSPLWYGWSVVCLALLVYAGGLAWYVEANVAAARTLAAELAADPAGALVAAHDMTPPGAFARAAAQSPSVDLLFPASAAVLALALGGTVYRFGRGTAWLYVAGGMAPLVALGAGPFLPQVAALDLLLVGVVPIAAALAFLGDVGRFLFGSG